MAGLNLGLTLGVNAADFLRRLSAADYRQQLQAWLPEGPIWPRLGVTRLTALLDGMAQELARLHNRAMDLLDEVDPRTTYELLAAWERVFGLPDECTVVGAETVVERQLRLAQKKAALGGQDRAYYITLADKLGYPAADVTEFAPYDCESDCEASVFPEEWRFVWRLDIQQETRIVEMDCESACDEPIRVWGDFALECVMDKLKPDHTHLLFSYGNGA